MNAPEYHDRDVVIEDQKKIVVTMRSCRLLVILNEQIWAVELMSGLLLLVVLTTYMEGEEVVVVQQTCRPDSWS